MQNPDKDILEQQKKAAAFLTRPRIPFEQESHKRIAAVARAEGVEITKLFNHFAGKEIELEEGSRGVMRLADKDNRIVTEMEAFAGEYEFTLRLWLPQMAGTMEYRADRINAHIVKTGDGKYRIGSTFNIG